MSTKRVRIILLSGTLLIVLVIGISLVLNFGFEQRKLETLVTVTVNPSSAQEAAQDSGGPGANKVAITAENVQQVIATLSRPASYSRSVSVENYYQSSSTPDTTAMTVNVKANGTAMIIDGAGGKKHIILAGDTYYLWYDGDREYLSGSTQALGTFQRIADEFQRLLTYEDVLKLDKKNIQSASYTAFGGEDCISVSYITDDVFKYQTICYISLTSGLLIGAEQTSGMSTIYRMTTVGYSAAEPDGSVFLLPDGKNALTGL